MKVKDLFILWLNKYVKLTVKIRTFIKYEYIINLYILPYLGELKLKTIDENVIQNYIYELLNINSKKTNNKLAINTIYGIVQVLKNGFQLAVFKNL